ncbi:PREDICTED: uncharacterized protein LOC104798767 isoform X1 [Tarenaya hassleriana]|uniref:uncharacterized protein LOC104798767 isoform X1 n=1 Tax=Tarenaya hassleriana TaxID=28532 RepID=UPI00053C76A7|nr:PREDICTED: uncharacterized protein LOC104798767 isoform X1 [Tarenaya hassleriana]
MERSDLSVVPVVFNGENYFYWSKAAKTVLSSRGLWSHIDEGDVVTNKGKSPETENSSQENDKWYQEDQKVLAILQSSLDQQILRSFILANSAKALWNNLKEVYEELRPLTTDLKVLTERMEQDKGRIKFPCFVLFLCCFHASLLLKSSRVMLVTLLLFNSNTIGAELEACFGMDKAGEFTNPIGPMTRERAKKLQVVPNCLILECLGQEYMEKCMGLDQPQVQPIIYLILFLEGP